MKRFLILACIATLAAGCTVKKQFSVMVEPPDAEITIVPGEGRPKKTYRSPADITVHIPGDPVKAANSRMEIKRETYQTKIIRLDTIEEKKHKIMLDKLVLYRVKYKLIRPVRSDDLRYRDNIVDIRLVPGDRQFELTVENLTGKPVKILWDRAQYIDFMNRPHTLMHSGIRPKDRNDIVQPQVVPAGSTLQQAVFPKNSVKYVQSMKEYFIKQLLPLYRENAIGLKGRTFSVFLPIELDRAIIPDYNFIFQIVEMERE